MDSYQVIIKNSNIYEKKAVKWSSKKKKIYHEKSIISARNGHPNVEPIGRLKPTFHRA